MVEQERKTWLRRRVEDGMRRGFQPTERARRAGCT